MTKQFADRSDAVDFLASHLRSQGLGCDCEDIATAIVDEWSASSTTPDETSNHRAVFRPARWVIRNQDLGLLDALSGILQGTATSAALVASTRSVTLGLATPAIAVVTYLIKVSLNARAKGVRLSEPEFFLLTLVREASDGASLESLQARWNARYPDRADGSLQPLLNKLTQYPALAGEIALVWKGSDDLWRVRDL